MSISDTLSDAVASLRSYLRDPEDFPFRKQVETIVEEMDQLRQGLDAQPWGEKPKFKN